MIQTLGVVIAFCNLCSSCFSGYAYAKDGEPIAVFMAIFSFGVFMFLLHCISH
jgi:hypothetical protein